LRPLQIGRKGGDTPKVSTTTMAASALSPPVELLLVAPVRDVLRCPPQSTAGPVNHNVASNAQQRQATAVAASRGWIRSDGLLDWSMFETFRPSAEEAQVAIPFPSFVWRIHPIRVVVV